MRIFHSTQSALEKELAKIYKEEAKLRSQLQHQKPLPWKKSLEEKIPAKVRDGIQKGFQKAFEITFEKGNIVIDKTYNKEGKKQTFKVKDYAVDVKGGRRQLSSMKKDAQFGHALNTVLTSVEGIGLGVLGIGLPDIVLWVGMLLRGVYETALQYGFDYETPQEKLFILKLLETPMLSDRDWIIANREIDDMILEPEHVTPDNETIAVQMKKTADAFATDVMVAKFIQSLPIVGIIGGATNPLYYNKVLTYVELKYRKRYLLKKMGKIK